MHIFQIKYHPDTLQALINLIVYFSAWYQNILNF